MCVRWCLPFSAGDREQAMSGPPFRHLKSSTDQGVMVLTITDARLDGYALPNDLRHEVLAAVAAPGVSAVILDFQGVEYISSEGLGLLISVRGKLQERGLRLVLCGLSAEVAEVFHICKLIRTD